MSSLRARGVLFTLNDHEGTLTIRRGLFGKRVRRVGPGVHASVESAAGRTFVLKIDGPAWAEIADLPSRHAAPAHAFAQKVNLAARL